MFTEVVVYWCHIHCLYSDTISKCLVQNKSDQLDDQNKTSTRRLMQVMGTTTLSELVGQDRCEGYPYFFRATHRMLFSNIPSSSSIRYLII